MSFTYGFYNSVGNDRVYDAEQFGSIFDGIISDGVFRTIGDKFLVTAPNNDDTVMIGTGRCWFNGTWGYNDTPFLLTLPTADSAKSRIDAVVIEVNHTEEVRATYPKIVVGVAHATPQRPTLTNAGKVHQYALAYVIRRALAVENPSVVKSTDITYVVGDAETPFASSILTTYL